MDASIFNIEVSGHPDDTTGCIVTVSGNFELARVEEFDRTIAPLLEHDGLLTVDVNDATLLDSAAIGALLRVRQARGEADRELRLLASRPYQKTLFELVGLSHILHDPNG